MSEPQGPLDTIPNVNYPPLLTLANYHSTKQMINQVLSEDQDYVTWKLKNSRTGGTMNSYVPSTWTPSRIESKGRVQKKRSAKINSVPRDFKFHKDIFDETKENIERTRELNQDEQFKLLVTNLDEEQTNRFEVFHRTSLNKGQVKKLAGTVTNQSINDNGRVFLQAIGKIYAGEIIELALDVRVKWFLGKMVVDFDRRKDIGKQLKKYLKKLTLLIEKEQSDFEDSVDETASDSYDDDDRNEMATIKRGNSYLKSKENSQELRLGLISHYNRLVKEFNSLDVSVEKYNNSPILPEHIREAWRLYRLQSDTVPSGQWRMQGERNGSMFR
ncbi:hypothetical protein NCAS_0F01170 [Naumovozyma castellii]|uniref:TAFII28-like protein domain-containing protein n=1 Tax=Naumovozyma castellii TaxID=27288 RepID=G0VGI0_NAUCA|nr:hypothetical protein NCAS_0F01170 [Naumovozyma castellii CBS 4309]CCC70601.1 hypothetical protein NCAS_0F01170 [Naumovozyma castellii CBS 4309]